MSGSTAPPAVSKAAEEQVLGSPLQEGLLVVVHLTSFSFLRCTKVFKAHARGQEDV